jgi:hypothetical protein
MFFFVIATNTDGIGDNVAVGLPSSDAAFSRLVRSL